MGGVSMVLSDLVDVIGGGTPKTTEESYWNGSIPWLSVKDFCGDKKYVYNTEKSITVEGLNNSSTKLLHKDNIIISARGTVGELAMIPYDMAFNQSCFGLIPKGNNDPHFVYYLLKDKVRSLKSQTQGSVFDTITKATFDRIECADYSEEDQHRIASILSSLDRKIELNNKINADLEEMAQAIFKNWFVDFEPFKDGKFVDSELGMIPEGWKVGTLFDIAEIFDKKRKPLSGNVREKMDKIYPYYGATSCMDYVDDYIFDGIYTLIGEDGSVVKENGLPYMQYVWGKMWVNNHAHILQGKNGYSTEMIHALLSITNIKFLVTGAVQAKLSQGNMQKILVAIPPKNVLDEIRPVIDNLYSKIRINTDENSRLSLLRDTLLPRLMSGELEVPE